MCCIVTFTLHKQKQRQQISIGIRVMQGRRGGDNHRGAKQDYKRTGLIKIDALVRLKSLLNREQTLFFICLHFSESKMEMNRIFMALCVCRLLLFIYDLAT